ncbi:MAG TPA: homoprotocatechuate degradation operon regulator HpaR, partial [Roseiarcus sp.]|nr:homoprotocatechuate degradation operon regulator HpaR [Roseiarcus sp.]
MREGPSPIWRTVLLPRTTRRSLPMALLRAREA